MSEDHVKRVERFAKTTGTSESRCRERRGNRVSRSDLVKNRLTVEIDTMRQNQKTRDWLMPGLVGVSLCWLIFTGFIVGCLAFGCGDMDCRLTDAVAVAFITTSLATVMGLPAIGLHYFFSPPKS